MPREFMPGEADVEVLIRSLGLFDDDALTTALQFLDLAIFADAALRQWEDETGWHPFLADVDEESDDQIRFFDPPGPNTRPHTLGGAYPMELGTGLVTLTSVTTGISTGFAGTLQGEGTDFWLRPYNADELGRPWTALEFVVPQWGARRSIKIIGRFGYASTVPDDVWLAISHQAVGLALPEIATSITGGMVEWKEADASERYGEAFLFGEKGIGSVWKMEWSRAVNRYKRVVL